MALTPEEAKAEAVKNSVAAGEEQAAIFLKKQYKNLGILYNQPDRELVTPTDEEEYRRMARELIDHRAFNAPTSDGGYLAITLEDLDKKDTQKELGIKASRGVGSLQELVPTRKQLNATADAIGEGVKENTGSVGFLGGATFMNAIKGFFSWVGSGFSGGFEGLKQKIAEVTAESMKESVGKNLAQLRAENPSMHHFLTDQAIDGIQGEVDTAVRKKAGLAVEETGPAASLENTRFETPDGNKLIEARIKIYNQVMNPPGQDKSLGEMIGDQMEAKRPWYGFMGGVTEASVRESGHKVSRVIADSVSTTVTDPNYRTKDGRRLAELNQQEYADAIADETGKALLAKEKQLGLPKELKEKTENKDKPDETFLDLFKDGVRNALTTDKDGNPSDKIYKDLSMVSNYAKVVSETPNSYLAEAQGAVDRDAGIGGAQPAELTQTPQLAAATSSDSAKPEKPWRGGARGW